MGEKMEKYQLEHVGVTVTDIDKAIDWYKTNLGFEVTRRFDKPDLKLQGATMTLGDDYLELLQPYTPEPKKESPGSLVSSLHKIGVNHLALNVDNISIAYSRLKANNVEFVGELTEGRYFFCRDPNGVLIEVRQRK